MSTVQIVPMDDRKSGEVYRILSGDRFVGVIEKKYDTKHKHYPWKVYEFRTLHPIKVFHETPWQTNFFKSDGINEVGGKKECFEFVMEYFQNK